jgi:hypothetical protein
MKSAMRPNAAELAEETLLWMIDPSRRLEVDAGDLAILLALELVSSLAAYNRAPLVVILATIAAAAPTARPSCATPTNVASGRRH